MLCAGGPCAASIIVVNYTVDAGGNNNAPLNGLSASASFQASGATLTILLTNTSSGAPAGADVSDSLLVSLAFNLPSGVHIASGDSARIGPGSVGLGAWAGRGPGDSVAEEWLWTNDFGGDLLEAFRQVISTSQGQGGGQTTSFAGEADPNVDGPFGGIAAAPPLFAVPASKPAVSNGIEFVLTLDRALGAAELQALAAGSIVEFGSDFRYLAAIPSPGSLSLLLLAGIAARSPRRRRP
jgi:hypothetical protein